MPSQGRKSDYTAVIAEQLDRMRHLTRVKPAYPVVGVLGADTVRLDERGARSGLVRLAYSDNPDWNERFLGSREPLHPGQSFVQERTSTVPRVAVRVDLETGEVLALDRHQSANFRDIDVQPSAHTEDSTSRRAHRARLYHLQNVAAKLAPDQRVCKCSKVLASAGGLDVAVDPAGKAFYNGVQTCGSVWHCPVCARKITEQRRADLQHMAEYVRSTGGELLLMTLTAPHRREDSLAVNKSAMTKAYRYLVSGCGALPNLLPGYGGTIRALEVTTGSNGWHVHFHVIILLAAPLRPHLRDALEQAIYDRWVTAWRRHGPYGLPQKFHGPTGPAPSRLHGVKLQVADVAGDLDPFTDYVCKWGVAEEASKLHTKKSASGDTPWTLLEKFDGGDKRAGALWREYAKVFKGGRQLCWSPGLRTLVGLAEEVSDEETAAALPEVQRVVLRLVPLEWLAVRYVGNRATVLDLAERGPTVLVDYVRRCVSEFVGAGGDRNMPRLRRVAVRRALVDWLDQVRGTDAH